MMALCEIYGADREACPVVGVRGRHQDQEGLVAVSCWIREAPHVHPVVLLLPGAARLVGGDAVDRQHGVVEDRVSLLPHGRHGLFQRGRESGQEVDGLAYVPVDRRDPDAEACDEAGVGVAAAQVGQDEQGLPASGQATPPGADPVAVACEETGEVLQGAAGQIDTGRVDKHAKAPGGLVMLVVNPSARSFLHAHRRGPSVQPPVRLESARRHEGHGRVIGSSGMLVQGGAGTAAGCPLGDLPQNLKDALVASRQPCSCQPKVILGQSRFS